MHVYYPHGGEHFMLTHWTHNEGTHIVLGRTPEACLAVVNSPKFTKGECPDVRSFERITIVQPPREFQYRVKVLRDERERESFRHHAFVMAMEYRDLTRDIPPGFRLCPKYIPKYEQTTERDDEEHFDCATCFNGLVVTKRTLIDLYAKALVSPVDDYTQWKFAPRVGMVPSRAPYADPTRRLCIMVSNPGPHSSGTEGTEADPQWNTERALFYYHHEEDLPEWLERAKKSVGDRKDAVDAEVASRRSAAALRAKERNERRRADLTAFFNTKV